MILLGVEEHADKSLHPIKLEDAQWIADEFWRIVNDKRKVSINVLDREDIVIIKSEDMEIVAVWVPTADERDKPIYIDGDLYGGSYKRSGEGDYHCTREEIDGMLQARLNS